ncbi:SDR family oxidoreductase [Candidatus Albibeggiatoa sp. nov. NOAA]|uniref:SDR family NAD(P)-dependent oxidoreductase n=1 Tax=Candidatus Albibeggiatoa sp. nov. NOAA TaxID=3162724 RepID=UPI003301E278|nr:SDR family oxidoreductase [Thiotrichaceae bacterium]
MQKTALVTGGNKGIGLAVTQYFLNHDYNVIVIARDFSCFELATHENVQTVEYDLSNIESIPELIASLGDIHVLINNAGVMYSLPYDDYPQAQVDRMIRLNIQAPVTLIQAVSKQMIERKNGRIVNNASIAGQTGHPDIWYGITKAGLINATKSFAKILGIHGIVINAIAASPTETDMLNVVLEERKNAFKKLAITGRFGKPSEVAETIGWLGTISPEYINGTCIDINNGSFPR